MKTKNDMPKMVGFVIILLMWLPTNFLFAQRVTGGLSGTVRDSSGAVVPETTVIARQIETGVETTTLATSVGDYSFPFLRIGRYDVTATHQGFASLTKKDLEVVVGENLRVDFQLPVMGAVQTVTVTENTPPIDVSSSSAGLTQTLQDIQDLPLVVSSTARTVTDFLPIQPGVIYQSSSFSQSGSIIQGTGDGSGFRQTTGFNIDGLPGGSQTTQSLAGNYGIIPDVIQEFRVTTNLEAASGWTTGPSIDVVTKSGTNRFHGTGFEYFRNDSLDARSFLASKVSPEKQNEFGGVFGGPIKKDKIFFVGSLDRYTFRTEQQGVVATVPTAKMKTGDFSELLGPEIGTDALGRPIFQGEIYDPSTTRPDGQGGFVRDPFSFNGQTNVIDPARFSSISQFFQKGYPNPNHAGTVQNWVGAATPQKIDQITSFVKTDWNFGRHTFSVGYSDMPQFEFACYTPVPAFGPEISTCAPADYRQYRFQVNYFLKVRPNLILNVRTGRTVNDYHGITTPPDGGANAGISGLYGTVTPPVSIQNTTGFGGPGTQVQRLAVYPTDVNVSWLKNSHNFEFGTNFIRPSAQQNYLFGGSGTYNYLALETGLPGHPTTGSGYASFLLGEVDSASLASPVSYSFVSQGWAFYAQDKWRVSPKLTLNLGLRWDISLPPEEKQDRESYFDPTVPNPEAGGRLGALTFMGVGTGRNGQHRQSDIYWKAFGPRFGVAYQLDSKTVLRGYYGIQYFPQFYAGYMGQSVLQSGWATQVSVASLNSGLTPAFNWDNGWPLPLPVLPNLDPSVANGSSVPNINPHEDQAGMSQNVGFGFERELPGEMTVRADYVGRFAHDMPTNNLVSLNQLDPKYLSLGNLLLSDINSPEAVAAGIPLPYPGFTGSVAQALRPFPQFNDIPQMDSKTASSQYNAFELTLRKRFRAGLSLITAYTFSKNLGNDQAACFQCYSAPQFIQHTDFRGKYHALLLGDVPQVLSVGYTYELPFGRGKRFLNSTNSVVDHLVGGWSVSGIQIYQSGTPIAIRTNVAIPSVSGVWANAVPGAPIRTSSGCSNYNPNDPNRSLYLNAGAFSDPAPFSFGNTSVLSNVRSCGFFNESLSAFKEIKIYENVGLKLGADFLNAFNRHSWTGLDSNIDDTAGFGRYTGTRAPRIIQLHMRVSF